MEHAISKKIISESVEQVEKWTKIVAFTLKVTPLAGLLIVILNLFFFRITDLGNDSAYELAVPMW